MVTLSRFITIVTLGIIELAGTMATSVTMLGMRTLETTVPVITNEMGTATTGDVMFMTPSTVVLFKVERATWNIPGLAATVRIPGISTKQVQYGVQKKGKFCDIQPRERDKKQVKSGYRWIVGILTSQHLISITSTKKFVKEMCKMAIDSRGKKTNNVVEEGVEVVELLLDNEAQHCIVY
ncbi:hypothetical protein BT96DRAFT_943636 [Gymnopus androsaceus JB14]|uniref:Uncharacterized protein n=1 Tax=Gymnopus androsaceus JB14 TaxID=1447944 RepID=A0A6A4H6U8_9AGAR|nr:hypothetical protein BT96DRAFT_943636 [Gymnopus androsaceus JB14]